MAQIVVRNLEEDVKRRLKERARRHGRSMEEEARAILRASLGARDGPEYGLGTQIARRFAGVGLRDDERIEEIRGEAKPAAFDC
ncbi:MAG: Arc family DNA-binding protein [Alphaproteobacteria bacterium]